MAYIFFYVMLLCMFLQILQSFSQDRNQLVEYEFYFEEDDNIVIYNDNYDNDDDDNKLIYTQINITENNHERYIFPLPQKQEYYTFVLMEEFN